MSQPANPDLEPYVPRELQQRLRESAGRMQGERRQVTFLFADLVGSTALAEVTDLELYKLLMDRALGTMIEGIVAYEGMVARISGDGLLAFFGAPLSHEDDSERAVRAALDIQFNLDKISGDVERSYGVGLRARIGIDAGEVVIGELGSDLRLEYTAVGPAVNKAARLESAAPHGATLVGESIYRETVAVFDYEAVGQLALKGFAEEVPAYRPLRVRQVHPGARPHTDGADQFVGRRLELALLEQAIEEVRSGRGQIVLVLGEAGIGKSRLVFEAYSRFGSELCWTVGRSTSYAAQISHYPFVEVVRDLTGIVAADTPTVASLKITRALSGLAVRERERHEPLLASLLNLPIDRRGEAVMQPLTAETTTERLGEAIGALIGLQCTQGALALVLDDLHWTDQGSIELLEQVLSVVEVHPVLVCLVLRPDTESSAWQLLGHVHATYFNRRVEIDVKPLADSTARELLEAMAPGEGLAVNLRARLLERSGGNPLSLQELVRAYMERLKSVPDETGAAVGELAPDVEIPDTIQKIILSRFDRLPTAQRRLLQAASVIGRRFSPPVLEAVLENPVQNELLTLSRADFVQERTIGERRHYVFKHWLTQEAIYSTLLDDERARLHKRTLHALEASGASAAELVHHALASGAGDRGVALSLAAGDEDMRLLAVPSATTHYRRAIQEAEHLERPDLAFEARARAGRAYLRVSDFAAARVELEAALAMAGGVDGEARIRALVDLLDAVMWLMDIPSLVRLAEETRALGVELGRRDVEVAAMSYLAAALGSQGDLPACISAYEETASLARRENVPVPPTTPPLECAARYWLGDSETAAQIGRTAVAIAREANHGGAVVFACSNLALALAGCGRYREAMEALEEAQRVGSEYGVHTHRARALAISSGFRNDLGDYAGAEHYAQEASELARTLDFAPPAVSAGVDLLVNYARRGEIGRTEPILPWVEEMSAKAAGFHGWLWSIRLLDARAEIAMARGDWNETLGLAGMTIEKSRSRTRPKYLVRGLLARARALELTGRTDDARADLREALDIARRLGDPALRLRALAECIKREEDEELVAQVRATVAAIRDALGTCPERDAFDASELMVGLHRHVSAPP